MQQLERKQRGRCSDFWNEAGGAGRESEERLSHTLLISFKLNWHAEMEAHSRDRYLCAAMRMLQVASAKCSVRPSDFLLFRVFNTVCPFFKIIWRRV